MAGEKATRQSYGETLTELGAEHGDILVLDADLAEATKTVLFRKAWPERHIDCGIAEQNMMGIAAGLSTMGKVPFVSSFAMFAAGRAFEQIRNSIGYPHLNVKIGATHAGISVGEDGASHQCCEDIALMRTIPGMTVLVPCDDAETRAAVRAAYETPGPVYLRLGRLAVPQLHDPSRLAFRIGRGIKVKGGTDLTIIAAGLCVQESLKAAAMLERMGISAAVIDMPSIKPIDRELILKEAERTGFLVTCEEHSVIGGLGSAVCEVLAEERPTPVFRIGMRDTFGESGPARELLAKYKLDAEGIRDAIAGKIAQC
jgi:transketolase